MSEYTRTRAIPNLFNFKIFPSFAVVANPICVPDCPRFLPTHVSTTAKPFLSTVLAIGILGLASGLGYAADLPSRQAPRTTVVRSDTVSDGDWNGYYAGVYAGADWLQGKRNLPVDNGSTYSTNGNAGPAAGLYGGYNWQFERIVAGLEADIGYSGADAKTKSYPDRTGGKTTVDWAGSVRGRLGYTLTPATMLYVTAGAAVGQVNWKYSIPETGDWGNKDKTEFGWIAGGGVEGKLTQKLSLRGEYLYSQFDGGKVKNHQTRAGLSYRF